MTGVTFLLCRYVIGWLIRGMATAAGGRNITVVKSCRTPVACIVTLLAAIGGIDVIGRLVVTGTTGAVNLGVVKMYRTPGDGAMTLITLRLGSHMPLRDGMTIPATAFYGRMIHRSTFPTKCGMTIITSTGGNQVVFVLAGRQAIVVALVTVFWRPFENSFFVATVATDTQVLTAERKPCIEMIKITVTLGKNGTGTDNYY